MVIATPSISERSLALLIPALAFAITLHTSLSYALALLILLLGMWDTHLRQRTRTIPSHPIAIAFLLIFALHAAGLLWTEAYPEGLRILSKQKIYVFAALFVVFLDKDIAQKSIVALIAAIFFSEFVSLYWIFYAPERDSSSPFMHHMHYSLVLCFTAAYLIHLIVPGQRLCAHNLACSAGTLLTVCVMFLNKGRIGLLALPVVAVILAVDKFKLAFWRAAVAVLALSACVFTLAYLGSAPFQARIDAAVYEFTEVLGSGKRDSITCRLEMWQYSLQIVAHEPLLGVGTGDSMPAMANLLGAEALDALHAHCGLGHRYQLNVHNNFILMLLQFGVVGFAVFLLALWLLLRTAIAHNNHPMKLLLAVTGIGMLTASPVSIHIKYMFFFTVVLSLLYAAGDTEKNSD
ncbi:MAG TPA: hypothetical protein DD979_12295 [Gammaproteobacteria bacterium]|jgi:O-antigen ligase|nr:hypothetical protein [Gammaproteobacteria bacterium]